MSDELPDDLELLAGANEKGIPMGEYLIDPMRFNALESLEFKGKFKTMPLTHLDKMLERLSNVDATDSDQVDDAYEEIMRVFGFLVYQIMKRTNPEAKPDDGMAYITMERLLTAFVAIKRQRAGDGLGEAPTMMTESPPAENLLETDGQNSSSPSLESTDIAPSI